MHNMMKKIALRVMSLRLALRRYDNNLWNSVYIAIVCIEISYKL